MACELLITGWYSQHEPREYRTFGTDSIRTASFRPLWWESVNTFVQPAHVYVTDSASPVKPVDSSKFHRDIRTVELISNPGHSQTSSQHYCGAMAAIIGGLEYANLSGVDYVIYIEQDALVFGSDFLPKIERALLRKSIVFGRHYGGEIEHTVMAFDRRAIRPFLSTLHSINYSDREIAPEFKFMYAASAARLIPFLPLVSWYRHRLVRRSLMKIAYQICDVFSDYDVLPFGYGRSRPINFEDPTFFFQQGSVEEVDRYAKLIGFMR